MKLDTGKQPDAAPALAAWLKHERIGGYHREFAFHDKRDWRLDFAWTHRLFAVEIEGIRQKAKDATRHQRAAGFEDDCEKYEAAMMDGWIVYRVPQTWIYKGDRRIWRPRVIEVIKEVLSEDGFYVCEICGCTDIDCYACIQRTGEPCYWVRPGLCSACAPEASLTL